ncbi:MAG: ABC transporter ATP-binding protein [Planctomycetaceae bacterium]
MLLELDNVAKSYRSGPEQIRAVDGVSLDIDAGEFVAVRGPSGCGKTTLLLMAGGLLSPEHGRVILDNQDLYATDTRRRAAFRATHVGFVFQQFHLVPYLSVADNVLVPSVSGTLDTATAHQRADELISRFGLQQRRDHVPSALSTGERQRAALARALLNQPRILLADEPTGNLDRENADVVLRHLRSFTDEGGAVLLVSHDDQAIAFADRKIDLEDGRIASEAASEA